jgi:hypothetical protein
MIKRFVILGGGESGVGSALLAKQQGLVGSKSMNHPDFPRAFSSSLEKLQSTPFVLPEQAEPTESVTCRSLPVSVVTFTADVLSKSVLK